MAVALSIILEHDNHPCRTWRDFGPSTDRWRPSIRRRSRASCTWTWMRFSCRWNCWSGPSCAANQSWSAEGRTSAAWSPPRAMKRANLAYSPPCRCARLGNFARTPFSSMATIRNTRSGAIASLPSSTNSRPWSKWCPSTKPTSIFRNTAFARPAAGRRR